LLGESHGGVFEFGGFERFHLIVEGLHVNGSRVEDVEQELMENFR
jgi:hypothetical protein